MFHVQIYNQLGTCADVLSRYTQSNNLPLYSKTHVKGWLSITDRVTEHNIYYSLGDLYLKQCMINDPASSYAKKCFSEYTKYTTFIYSGTRGTHIPKDVQSELDELEKMGFDAHG